MYKDLLALAQKVGREAGALPMEPLITSTDFLGGMSRSLQKIVKASLLELLLRQRLIQHGGQPVEAALSTMDMRLSATTQLS